MRLSKYIFYWILKCFRINKKDLILRVFQENSNFLRFYVILRIFPKKIVSEKNVQFLGQADFPTVA